jgi:probable rRNA maturation factor
MAAAVQVQFAPALAAAQESTTDRTALRRLLGRAVRAALRDQAVAEAEISLTLMDDDGIAELNQRFLAHDGPTDVISFALYDEGEPAVGDVYIGLQQARRQADGAGVSLDEELVRLAVHGTLHVLGHEHPAGDERLDSEMWSVQERIVRQVAAP